MTDDMQPTAWRTTSALEAIGQRFPEDQIKVIYIKLLHTPKAGNLIKVQLVDNTYWELKQKWTGSPTWEPILQSSE